MGRRKWSSKELGSSQPTKELGYPPKNEKMEDRFGREMTVLNSEKQETYSSFLPALFRFPNDNMESNSWYSRTDKYDCDNKIGPLASNL